MVSVQLEFALEHSLTPSGLHQSRPAALSLCFLQLNLSQHKYNSKSPLRYTLHYPSLAPTSHTHRPSTLDSPPTTTTPPPLSLPPSRSTVAAVQHPITPRVPPSIAQTTCFSSPSAPQHEPFERLATATHPTNLASSLCAPPSPSLYSPLSTPTPLSQCQDLQMMKLCPRCARWYAPPFLCYLVVGVESRGPTAHVALVRLVPPPSSRPSDRLHQARSPRKGSRDQGQGR